jgi:hypothetical protein
MMLVASDSGEVQGKAVGGMSEKAMAEAADATMEMLRARLGRAPKLEEVQRAMLQIGEVMLEKLHAEEGGGLNSGRAPSVKTSHDDAGSS